MTTNAIKQLGAEFYHAADGVGEALRRLEHARADRLAFLRQCFKDSTARLAALKEVVRALPEQIAKWDAEAARLESQTAEDLLRQALDARKCDGDHKGPTWAEVEAMADAAEKPGEPKMIDLRTLTVGTEVQMMERCNTLGGDRLALGQKVHIAGISVTENDGSTWCIAPMQFARVVKEGGGQ